MEGVNEPMGEPSTEGVAGPELGPNGESNPGPAPEGVAGVIPRFPRVGVAPESWRLGVPGAGVIGVVAPESADFATVLRKGVPAMLSAAEAHCWAYCAYVLSEG